MKRYLRFKLRTLLLLTACTALLLGVIVNYSARSVSQRNNVKVLEQMGGQFHSRQGAFNNIQIWYSDDLRWNADESRFEIALSFGEPEGLRGWIEKQFGRDFVHYPVALEIMCHDFDLEKFECTTTFDDEMVEQIEKLSTVQQVWIAESTNGDGNLVNVTTNEELKQYFPNLIVASPQ